ncbi:MAG TPA: tetratricopeptide repeat protein, partial [Solirubrobacteraceae bacterium]
VYELPDGARALDTAFVAIGVTVLAITSVLYVMRSRWPAALAAWVAYVVTLAPVSGLATWSQAGRQVVADRYSYLACLPWAVLVGAGVCVVLSADSRWLRSHRSARAGLAAGVAAWIVALAAVTVPQIGVWRDGETLWRYALEVDPDCALCHSQLGAVLGNRGAVVPALAHFERAVAIRPDELIFRSNHALALLKVGRASEAAEAYRSLTARRPDDVELLSRFGAALLQANDPRGAATQFERAVALEPGNTLARAGAARAYLAAGDAAASRRHLEALRDIDAELARQVERPSGR